MGRGRRWGILGGLLLACATFGGLARGDLTALFPGALYVFVQPADLIRAKDFNPLAKEVEAIERTLGVGLGNIPATRAPTFYLENPIEETLPTIWTAPEAGRIVSVRCDTTGVGSQVILDFAVDDGTPSGVGVGAICTEATSTYVPANGAMAAGDRLDLALSSVIGAPSRVSISWVFQPGA